MAFLMTAFSVSSWAQVNMAANGSYVQDFNTLKTSGTAAWSNNSTLPNWYASNFNNNYGAEGTSTNSGGLKSYGTGTNTERALGSAGSGTANPAYGVVLRNTSGATMTDIKISYTGEQWRNGGNVDIQSLKFYYRKSSSAITSISAGATNFTAVPALNFASKIGTATAAGLDGNVAANRTIISDVAIPNLSLADDEYIIVKWDDENDSGNDHGLGIDDLTITWTVASASPTWDGTQWVGGVTPTASTDAIIAGDYTGAGFTAQSVTVNSTFTLTINSGETVTTGNLSNNGNIIVNDGGNLIQTVGSTYTPGTGASFVANRNSTSVANKYVFWSSPVVDQNIFTAYTSGSSATAPTYVMTYNTGSNLYDIVTNADANFTGNAGKGYSVKVPQTNAGLSFGGTNKIPNNGVVNVALAGTAGSLNNFNLIGNPYPSNLDLNAFYTANNTAIGSTLWFWDNTTGNVTTQTGNTSTNVGYATVNLANPAGTTWVEAPGTQSPSYSSASLNAIGNVAKAGQAFIVKAVDAGSVSFTNAMRSSATGVTLNKNVDANAGKFWIKLTTSYGNTLTQAVTYNQGALDAYDVYDSKAMGMGSDAFYSLVGAEKLVIQGKSSFNINDVVPLGTKHFENGSFTVSLSHKEGLFTNGQAIYLHDKTTGTYTNLQNQAYTFTGNAEESANRFEIVYKLDVLATSEVKKDTFEVYREGEDFFVRNSKNIENIQIFDAAGRKMQNIDSNSKLVRIKLESKGLYIIKATSTGKEYSKKIIK